MPGCRSGYTREETPATVTYHKFPLNNPSLLQKWLRKIPRKDYVPTKYSVVCSLHFIKSDFVTDSQDRRRAQKRSNTKLMRRRLMDDAIPSKFPNCPSYLSSEPAQRRDEGATANIRRDKEQERLNDLEKKFFEAEQVSSLAELQFKLRHCSSLPSGFTEVSSNDCACYVLIEFSDRP